MYIFTSQYIYKSIIYLKIKSIFTKQKVNILVIYFYINYLDIYIYIFYWTRSVKFKYTCNFFKLIININIY